MSKAIDYISSCGGAGFTWENKTNSFSVQKNFGYFVDTETQAVTATLPSSTTVGDSFYIVDQNGTANSATPIVVEPNGGKIQGSSDPMIISSPYTSIYMVYANNIDGWVVADGKAGDCGIAPTDNIIPVDTTIYVAPSASVDGVIPVGSDVDGDGSYEKPFFSIKRAIEFLENYRIKVGVYVTIRGLPGKYQYNDNHVVEVKHKDAKYIKVQFDMMESGYYHQTTITGDTVTQDTSNSSYDLIEFTVNNIGTGHNQIQAGDYIKIYANNDLWDISSNASWNGYYKVESVDVPNNKITIIFKRHQESGSYSGSHSYLLPTTVTNNTINVLKLSTHIYFNPSSINNNNFFYSEFGFGSIQINISDEYYYTNNVRSEYKAISIYDGVLNDIILNINGFIIGSYLENLKIYFIDTDIKTYSFITSCDTGIKCVQSNVKIPCISTNNNNTSISLHNSICDFIGNNFSISSISINNYNFGIYSEKSIMHFYTNNSYYAFCSFYNLHGISLWRESTMRGGTVLSTNNHTGLNVTTSSISLGSNTSVFNNNNHGIDANNGSIINVTGINCQYNTTGLYITENSGTVTDGSPTILTHNNTGLYALSNCNIRVLNAEINNNSFRGVEIRESSSMLINNSNINDNDYGIYCVINSKIMIRNETSSYRINNNTSNNVRLTDNAECIIYTHDAITNTTPSKNTSPSYSDVHGGCYILEGII